MNIKKRSALSLELYDVMVKRGYPAEFAFVVSNELNTDYTAGRMIGYISQVPGADMEAAADEMLGILSDRERFINKKIAEDTQAKINELYANGLGAENEE